MKKQLQRQAASLHASREESWALPSGSQQRFAPGPSAGSDSDLRTAETILEAIKLFMIDHERAKMEQEIQKLADSVRTARNVQGKRSVDASGLSLDFVDQSSPSSPKRQTRMPRQDEPLAYTEERRQILYAAS